MKAKLVLAAMLAATLVPSAADAGERDWRSVRVDIAALDLSTPAGMTELERRVRRAVDRICADDRSCRDEAWASTEAQAAYAIRRDVYMRRMAAERAAQLRVCGGHPCEVPQQARYAPPPPPPPPPPPMPIAASGGTTVITIVHTAPPVVIYAAPPQQYWR